MFGVEDWQAGLDVGVEGVRLGLVEAGYLLGVIYKVLGAGGNGAGLAGSRRILALENIYLRLLLNRSVHL